MPLIRKGTALVFDDAPDSDVGTIGSNNILAWRLRGCVGVVTNVGGRDTDEIATERMPLYLRHVARGIRPGATRSSPSIAPSSAAAFSSGLAM